MQRIIWDKAFGRKREIYYTDIVCYEKRRVLLKKVLYDILGNNTS